MDSSEAYIHKQISVYKNKTRLLEFMDKLQRAPTQYYAHIHASNATDIEGERRISCIGLNAVDYSKGTGDHKVTVTANISPQEAEYLFRRVSSHPKEFHFERKKKYTNPMKVSYAKPVADGKLVGTNLYIDRKLLDEKGIPRKNPWTVSIENFMSDGTKRFVTVAMTDEELFSRLYDVTHYVQVWEMVQGTYLYREAMKALAEQKKKELAG